MSDYLDAWMESVDADLKGKPKGETRISGSVSTFNAPKAKRPSSPPIFASNNAFTKLPSGQIRGILDVAGTKYAFGSGGAAGYPHIPLGDYPITPEAVGPWGKEHGAIGINNNAIFDKELGRNRAGIELHAGSSDALITKGCIAVAGDKWPILKAQVLDMIDKNGKAYLHVGEDGARISPTKSGEVDLSSTKKLDEEFQKEFLTEVPTKIEDETPSSQPAPSVVQTLTPSFDQRQAWGPLMQAADRMTFGHGPQIAAAGQATREAYEDWKRGVPLTQIPEITKNLTYPRAVTQWQEAQDAWGVRNPGSKVAADIGGEIVPVLAGIGATNAAIRGAASLSPKLVPVANFLMGTGGEGVAGAKGFLARRASDVAAGGIQGAVGNAITGRDVGEGAAWGAGINPVVNPLVRGITAPMRATMRPEVAQAVKNYLGLGGEVPAASVIADPKLARTVGALAGKGEPEAVENFTSQLADRINAKPIMATQGVKGLTPEVLKEAREQIYQGFDNFAAQRGVVVDTQLMTELHNLRKDAMTSLTPAKPEAAKAVLKAIDRIEDAALNHYNGQNFFMSGKSFRQLTSRGSVVDELFKTDHDAVPYATQLKDALYSALERTLPEAKQEINSLRQQYRDLIRLEKVAQPSPTGLLNPKQVARRFGKETDDFGKIAQMGEFLPVVDSAGNIKGEAPSFLSSLVRHGAPTGAGGSALGAGLGVFMAEHGMGWIPQIGERPLAAAGVGLGAGAGLAARHALGKYLSSPAYMQRLLENSLTPSAQSIINPAMLAVPTLSRREKRK